MILFRSLEGQFWACGGKKTDSDTPIRCWTLGHPLHVHHYIIMGHKSQKESGNPAACRPQSAFSLSYLFACLSHVSLKQTKHSWYINTRTEAEFDPTNVWFLAEHFQRMRPQLVGCCPGALVAWMNFEESWWPKYYKPKFRILPLFCYLTIWDGFEPTTFWITVAVSAITLNK